MRTKADYDGESKKGKLRSPKIAEFSISIIEGVSERLKVRTSLCFIPSPLCRRAASLLLRTFTTATLIFPSQSCTLWLLLSGHLDVLRPDASRLVRQHNDSLRPTLKVSLNQLLPW